MFPNTTIHGAYPVTTTIPAAQSQYLQSVETENANDERFKPYLDKDNPNLSAEQDADNQDSGHPSLDQSGTPSNTTVELGSNPTSPVNENGRKDSENGLKNNPFTVNGVKRAPNKIILEPIEKPLKDKKHLFAAKKLSE